MANFTALEQFWPVILPLVLWKSRRFLQTRIVYRIDTAYAQPYGGGGGSSSSSSSSSSTSSSSGGGNINIHISMAPVILEVLSCLSENVSLKRACY